jgi:abortive infection Abi-like protein
MLEVRSVTGGRRSDNVLTIGGPSRRDYGRTTRPYHEGVVFSFDEPEEPSIEDPSLVETAVFLQTGLIAQATDGSIAAQDYKKARARLMGDARSNELVPSFVRACRDPSQFWAYNSRCFPRTASGESTSGTRSLPCSTARREGGAPGDVVTTEALSTLDADHVVEAWQKALDRRTADPEGAITAARMLLESVCKLILDDLGEAYSDDDLPRLYGKVAKGLKLAPSDHTEEAFKQILGGCYSVVNGLGTLRNRLSDSHGKGAKPVRPAPRHAELAVNLAGGMASFLVATWEARRTAPLF